jgi:acetyltransferase-like isoleucine patch superfamily enzyme
MKFNNNFKLIGTNISIGLNVKIGDDTIIYGNTIIGDNSIIANNCIIGEPSVDYYYSDDYTNNLTTIGQNCLIRSHAIIYNGNKIGNGVTTGHRIMLRENNDVGNNCRIGNYTELHGNVQLGKYSNLHSSVCIVENAIIGDFVWIAPGTILTNDITPPSNNKKSPVIGDYTFIAVNCIILPGVKVGAHCLIGASTTVTRDIDDYSVCIGSPGKIISDIKDFEIKGIKHYPWPYNFDRGMPWENIGYQNWLAQKGND